MENKQTNLCIKFLYNDNELIQGDCKIDEEAQLFKFKQFKLLPYQKIKVQPIGQLLIHNRNGLCVTKQNRLIKLYECKGNINQL